MVLLLVSTFPLIVYFAETIPSNNDLETWLPADLPARVEYNDFKDAFGADEVILVGLSDPLPPDNVVEAFAARLDRIRGLQQCWSPQRIVAAMTDLDVPARIARERLSGLLISEDDSMIGLIATLNEYGVQNRLPTVAAVRDAVTYCQLDEGRIALGGSPVVVAELDRLGNRNNTKPLFIATLGVCFCLLQFSLRNIRLSGALLLITVWAIDTTLAGLNLAGVEMNFILNALPVMVMVFTITVAIHVVHYYRSAEDSSDPLAVTLRTAVRPCCLAVATTVIGLVSLAVSDMAPVRLFGLAAAFGSIISLFAGLGLTPILLTLLDVRSMTISNASIVDRLARLVVSQPVIVSSCAVAAVFVTAMGLPMLTSRIDPLDFLPAHSDVRQDYLKLDSSLTSSRSIETIVDLTFDDRPFFDRLAMIREIESAISNDPAIRHTLSAADFLPDELPDGAFAAADFLARANASNGSSSFLIDDANLWRISARLHKDSRSEEAGVAKRLQALVAHSPATVTGVAPLLDVAQKSIFDGFWKSFSTAFFVITIVMIVALRSWKAGLLAMIPNLTPICLVFGSLGWFNMPLDIGMMMTGSIAVGIAVDGTFHFLLTYRRFLAMGFASSDAALLTLRHTGLPILMAALISAMGMLALTCCSFVPTARFGMLMAVLLLAAVVGDLVFLPALLSLRHRPSPLDFQHESTHRPHFDCSSTVELPEMLV